MVIHSLLQRSRLSFPTEYLVSYEFISSITFLMGHIRIFFVWETQEGCPCPPPVHTLGSCSGRAHPLFRDLTFTTLCVPHTLPLLVPCPWALPGPSTPSPFHRQDSSLEGPVQTPLPSQSFANKDRPLWSVSCSPSTGWGKEGHRDLSS